MPAGSPGGGASGLSVPALSQATGADAVPAARAVQELKLQTVVPEQTAVRQVSGQPFYQRGEAWIDGLLRASYDTISREALHMIGVRRRAIVVGEGEHLDHLLRTLGSVRGGIEYEFLGVVTEGADDARTLPRLGRVDDLRAVLEQHSADELIVTDSDYTDRQLLQIVDYAHRSAVKVRIAPKTTELLVQRAEYVPGQGVPLFELRPPAFLGAEWALKRAFDLVVSGLVIVVGSPLWLAIAAAIKLTSPGPVFYRDRRIGLGEQSFGMFKFRTMVAGAAAQQSELEDENEAEARCSRSGTIPGSLPSASCSAASRSTSCRT